MTHDPAPHAKPSPFLQGQALHAIDRLRDHIERVDQGKVYAADDLAVVLRLLVHPGRGNDVLGRLQRQFSTRPIEITATRAPETADNVLFSFGSLPARAKSESLGTRQLLLHEWIASPFLKVATGDSAKTWTWADFINTYANKWGGAHLDDRVPETLQVIDLYTFGGFSLSSYFLRAAGVAVWKAAENAWLDGTLRDSGNRLSEQQLATIRAASVGPVADPADRLAYGEPQFFAYRGDSAEIDMLISRHASCTARISVGGKMVYDAVFQPHDATSPPATTHEVRTPVPQVITAEDFSQHRVVKLQGRILAGD